MPTNTWTPPKCQDCKYYVETINSELHGECRIEPPKHNPIPVLGIRTYIDEDGKTTEYDTYHAFAQVFRSDFCSLHEFKEYQDEKEAGDEDSSEATSGE